MGRRIDHNLPFDTTYYPVAACSCAFFLYLYRYISPKLSSKFCPRYDLLTEAEQIDWNTRVGSTVHSVVLSVVCIYTMIYNDEIAEEPIWWDSRVVRTSCAIVTGYMASDFVVLTIHYKQVGEVFYVLHHCATIYAYYYVTTYGVLPYFANYRLLAEVSTPFVNQRWFLVKLGYSKTSPMFVGNGLAMAATFFSGRIVIMPSYWMRVYNVYNTPAFNALPYSMRMAFLVPSLMLDIINIYWFWKILAGAYRVCCCFYVKDTKPPTIEKEKQFSSSFSSSQSLVPDPLGDHRHID